MADADDFDVESLLKLLRGESCPAAPAKKPAARVAAAGKKAPAKKRTGAAAARKAKPAARAKKSPRS